MSFVFLISFLLISLSINAEKIPHKKQFLRVEGGVFRDSLDRQVILHGMNLVNKSKESNLKLPQTLEDFKTMRNWGVNCIRLGITWSALEPQPGQYDIYYLQRLLKCVHWAKDNGIYILLDMHQDLYGEKFGNGAPLWATLDNGLPHQATEVWDDAYYTSQAVKTSFDNFWNNLPVTDGIGVQQHLVNAWQFVGKYFEDQTNVIGFDIMNEPFIGGAVDTVQETFLTELGKLYQQEGKAISPEELFGKWTSTTGREEIMNRLNDTIAFKKVINATEPFYARFEQEKLMPFYQRVYDAIRKVGTNHIFFTEPSVSANIGIYSHLSLFKTAVKDIQQVYAPHAYDLVTDTKFVDNTSFSRLELIYKQEQKKASEMNLPLMVGEWGAFYGASKEVVPVAAFSAKIQEQLLCSDLYWSYTSDLQNRLFFPYINRAYPMATAGKLIYYHYDLEKHILSIKWKETANSKGGTLIFIPSATFSVQLQHGELMPAYKINKTDKNALLMQVKPLGKSTERSLCIKIGE